MSSTLTWSRTIIAGKTEPGDFICHDETGRSVGRIYPQHTGHEAGSWYWCMNAIGPDIDHTRWTTSGTMPTKQEAAE